MPSNQYIIAIDGHSSSGKSTLAKRLASALNYIYIDSGAMYRAVALYLIDRNISVFDKEQVVLVLDQIHIIFKTTGSGLEIYLNDQNVSTAIRKPEITAIVSEVAAISEVRKKLVELQRSYGKQGGIVMDGRDIGSVVFPNADLKLFVTANLETRTERRYQELIQKGVKTDHESVKKNLLHRDHIDSTRTDSPLIQLKEAVFIDNSDLTIEEQIESIKKLMLQLV